MKAAVSVVMPHYNALDTVARSIESVIAQSLAVQELIIVDDASPDFPALANLVTSYRDRLDIRLVPLMTNSGASHARNVGVEHASSPYIALLDSDDVWHPQKVEIQYGYMQTHAVELTAHGYVFDLQQQPFAPLAELTTRVISQGNFIWGNPIFTPTVMARKERFVAFDARFRRVDDYKCWYENLQNGNHVLLCIALAGGFKPPIGASGLTASTRLMHESYLEVLRSLRVEGNMPLGNYLLTVLCETFKYPFRSLLVRLRKK